MDCPSCGEELEETSPGVDNLMDDEVVTYEFECNNEECEHHDKPIVYFYDFTRIEVDGEEI